MSRTRNIGFSVLTDLMRTQTITLAKSEDDSSVITEFADRDKPLRISGIGNDGLRQEYSDKIFAMSDEEFLGECEGACWRSAYAANNANSDYHWQVDLCYYEALRRGDGSLYDLAHRQAMKSAGYDR